MEINLSLVIIVSTASRIWGRVIKYQMAQGVFYQKRSIPLTNKRRSYKVYTYATYTYWVPVYAASKQN